MKADSSHKRRSANVASPRGKFGDKTFHLSPWAKLVAGQWSWVPMLNVSWRCQEPSFRKYFWGFISRKGNTDAAVAPGVLQVVLQQRGSSGAGEIWVCTNLLPGSNKGVVPLPAEPSLLSTYWRTRLFPKAITSAMSSLRRDSLTFDLIKKANLMGKLLIWVRISSLHWT